jgi:hypothetical protein
MCCIVSPGGDAYLWLPYQAYSISNEVNNNVLEAWLLLASADASYSTLPASQPQDR